LESYKKKLAYVLSNLTPLGETAKGILLELAEFYSYKKKEFILRAGDPSKKLFFICKGSVSIYYLYGDGKKYTKNLLFENDFPAATSSFLQKRPSNLTIEALEDCIMLGWDFAKLKELTHQHDEIKDMYVSYLERSWVVEKELREISFVTESAEKRYDDLLGMQPGIENRIAQHHIASYLGITPIQLSRIRSRRRNR